MKMKLKKTLTAAGALMALALAGQGLAVAQTQGDAPDNTPPTIGGAYGQFNADMGVFCGASQPFADPSDPQWNCGDTTRTYNAIDPNAG